MRLTTRGRYAVTATLDLFIFSNASSGKEDPVSLSVIAENQNISLSYLEQLFTKLRKANLVKGQRGPGGGYVLARSADQISIAQIITAVDERMDVTQCGGMRNCMGGKPCSTHGLWSKLSEKLFEFLDSISVKELSEWPSVQNVINEVDGLACDNQKTSVKVNLDSLFSGGNQ